MNKATFWHLIEDAKEESKDDCEQCADGLIKKLLAFSATEIIEFHDILWELMGLSYTNDLWAAAYIINGGCSDDGFDYFRGWLIAQGEAVFYAALKDPEMLVYVLDQDADDSIECENMLGVAWHAYQNKTDSKLPSRPQAPWHLTGEEWDEATVDRKYPKLAARFYS